MDYFDRESTDWDANLYRVERAEVVAQGIRSAVPLKADMTAFEYGCGTGLLSFALQPHLGSILLADSSSGMLSVLDQKIAAGGILNMRSMKLDLITDPLPTLKVQLIYTLMTLHHIQDSLTVLKRFYELLDTGGYLCIADLDKEDGSFHGPDFDGHKGFDRGELGAQVKACGFKQVKFETIYHTPRMVGENKVTFPVFLMTARALPG